MDSIERYRQAQAAAALRPTGQSPTVDRIFEGQKQSADATAFLLGLPLVPSTPLQNSSGETVYVAGLGAFGVDPIA